MDRSSSMDSAILHRHVSIAAHIGQKQKLVLESAFHVSLCLGYSGDYKQQRLDATKSYTLGF